MNIGPRARRLRVASGLVSMSLFVTGVFVLGAMRFPREWRLLLFLPAMGAALGFLQAYAKTCVVHALRGTKDLDDGAKPCEPAEAEPLRAGGWKILLRSFLIAAALTAAAFAIR